MSLEVADVAPPFCRRDQDGTEHSLAELALRTCRELVA
jgi:hypothetical protein